MLPGAKVSRGRTAFIAVAGVAFSLGVSSCQAIPIHEGSRIFRVLNPTWRLSENYQWCGPGIPEPGSSPEPWNDLDRACRSHDWCYERAPNSCGCDQQLVETILKKGTRVRDYDDRLDPYERRVVMIFLHSACRGGCKHFIFKLREAKVCGPE